MIKTSSSGAAPRRYCVHGVQFQPCYKSRANFFLEALLKIPLSNISAKFGFVAILKTFYFLQPVLTSTSTTSFTSNSTTSFYILFYSRFLNLILQPVFTSTSTISFYISFYSRFLPMSTQTQFNSQLGMPELFTS